MLIKKIELKNFRQFKGTQTINFSTDKEKNVTVIMGENGAGKTTLAQAFRWVLYHDTDFKIKELINREIRDTMTPQDEIVVQVVLYILHNGKDYKILTKQKFVRDIKNVKEQPIESYVAEKTVNTGDWVFLKGIAEYSFIKKMLPKELSKFFFFDGERIKTMSDEIEAGKSREFADAVRGLVGLTAMMQAIEHFKPSSTTHTVIGRLNKLIDATGSQELSEYTREIESYSAKIERLQERNSEIEPNIKEYYKQAGRLQQELLSMSSAIELKEKYQSLESSIKELEIQRKRAVGEFFKYFSKNSISFFSKPLLEGALKEVKNAKKLDKGIPYIHADTVKFLLNRKFCICGTKLEDDNEAVKALEDIIDYLPPKALGDMIGQFSDGVKSRTREADSFLDTFRTWIRRPQELEENIQNRTDEAGEIYHSLTDTSKAQVLRKRKEDAETQANRLNNELNQNNRQINTFEHQMSVIESKKNKLVETDAKNRENSKLLQCASEVYTQLIDAYNGREEIVRKSLEDKINKIFEEIYDGGIQISVNERYNIKTIVTDTEASSSDELEKNTAQSYAIIFAFIAGIIEMAKEDGSNLVETDFEEDLNGYPLVMDAPLSSFDKTRISRICNALPDIAQQVVMFIKDTDGDVAEEHLTQRIGQRWLLKAETKTCTRIESR